MGRVKSSGRRGGRKKCGGSNCELLTYGATGILFLLNEMRPSTRLILMAAIMSAAWVGWYGYNYRSPDQIMIAKRFNVTTWLMWTLILTAGVLVYRYMKRNTTLTFWTRVIFAAIMWTLVIMILEWIGYNVFKIQLTSNYPGLWGFKLLHGPWYMKVYYLTAWAILLTILGEW